MFGCGCFYRLWPPYACLENASTSRVVPPGAACLRLSLSIWPPCLPGEKATVLCTGSRVTRHPRMGAVEEPKVPRRERLWNEQATATRCENAGVYRLLCVNVSGIRQLAANRRVLGSGAVTCRLLCVNVLKTNGGWPTSDQTTTKRVPHVSILRHGLTASPAPLHLHENASSTVNPQTLPAPPQPEQNKAQLRSK